MPSCPTFTREKHSLTQMGRPPELKTAVPGLGYSSQTLSGGLVSSVTLGIPLGPVARTV